MTALCVGRALRSRGVFAIYCRVPPVGAVIVACSQPHRCFLRVLRNNPQRYSKSRAAPVATCHAPKRCWFVLGTGEDLHRRQCDPGSFPPDTGAGSEQGQSLLSRRRAAVFRKVTNLYVAFCDGPRRPRSHPTEFVCCVCLSLSEYDSHDLTANLLTTPRCWLRNSRTNYALFSPTMRWNSS